MAVRRSVLNYGYVRNSEAMLGGLVETGTLLENLSYALVDMYYRC